MKHPQHNLRKSFKKWAAPIQRLKPDTTLKHLKATACHAGSMANHNAGAFGKAVKRFFATA